MFLNEGFNWLVILSNSCSVNERSGGNWNNPASWAGGVVPASTDPAIIVAGATATVTANATVASVTTSGRDKLFFKR